MKYLKDILVFNSLRNIFSIFLNSIYQVEGGLEEKRKKYYLIDEVWKECYPKVKNMVET